MCHFGESNPFQSQSLLFHRQQSLNYNNDGRLLPLPSWHLSRIVRQADVEKYYPACDGRLVAFNLLSHRCWCFHCENYLRPLASFYRLGLVFGCRVFRFPKLRTLICICMKKTMSSACFIVFGLTVSYASSASLRTLALFNFTYKQHGYWLSQANPTFQKSKKCQKTVFFRFLLFSSTNNWTYFKDLFMVCTLGLNLLVLLTYSIANFSLSNSFAALTYSL